MTDDKKPKIDLKARLGKTAVGGATPSPQGVGGGLPIPTASASSTNLGPIPVPAPSTAGLPAPQGALGAPFAAPPSAVDPRSPLAAAAAPPRPQAPAPVAQRIEVDEVAIEDARKGARKQGVILGVAFGVVLGIVGYVAGGALETSKARAQSVAHARSLAGDVARSRTQLKALAEKLEAGRTALAKDRKFPDSLAKDLGGVNIDFDGTKLAGVRFSGFSQETTTGLIEYISGVQSTNDRKNAVMGLLGKLQKPLTEQLAAQASGKPPAISFVVLLKQDSAKNPYGVLAPLQKPVELSATMPAEYVATDPLTKANVTAPKFTSLDKPGAAYIVPKSIEAAFPSETSGQIAQLVGQLSRLITDVRGEGGAQGDVIAEPKPGLLERAERLEANLNKVQ